MRMVDENTIEIELTVASGTQAVTFERGYLERQRGAIISQRDEYCAARDKELAEVDEYLLACDALGIVAKPMPANLEVS